MFYRAIIAGLFLTRSVVAAELTTESVEYFEKHIRPVLVTHCYECHSENSKSLKGGLKLDSREAVLQGGESGAAVVANDPDSSLLLSALRYEDFEMPPKGKLPESVIHHFDTWIQMGAPDPRNETVSTQKKPMDLDAARQEWAFQAPQVQTLPTVELANWPQSRIDFFVLAQLEERQLPPSPTADPGILVRRLYYDLIGLPPTSADTDQFLHGYPSDPEGTIQHTVDRLLSSSNFGEKWARMWLDVARYAEDQAHIVGNNKSLFFPNAFHYRNWVIESFNNDMPYDRFVSIQLAADLLEPENEDQQVGLGFIGLGPKYYNRGRLEVQADEWEDRVDTVGRGLLGLTVACARCHDHKYDPISTQDYYGLAGVFASTEMFNRPFQSNDAKKDGQAKNPDQSVHIVREGNPTDLKVFIRGNHERQGELVARRFPLVLCSEKIELQNGSGRQELAEAIVDPQNPLTSRVFVNRVIAQLVGRGIVATPSNFGALGDPPTHPKLLDDLARRFVQNGWSLKWLVREIVSSATYQQSSLASSHRFALDPDNHWLGRMNRRRLSVEQWRDTILQSSGKLEKQIGGPSIDIQNPQESRRTIYSSVSRFQLNPMLVLFDFPDANVHSANRSETTTPLQKLFVMNNEFLIHHANRLATQVMSADHLNMGDRITLIYRRIFSRTPEASELRFAMDFVEPLGPSKVETWQHYIHALMASNELIFID